MKVLMTVTCRNFVMVEARKKIGISQAELAVLVGTSSTVVSEIELLRNVGGRTGIDMILCDIADALDVQFDVLFPPDYLDALYRGKLLPRRGGKYSVVFDGSAGRLAGSTARLLESGDPVDSIAFDEMAVDIADAMSVLPPRERQVIEARYGFGGRGAAVMEDVAKQMGITRERVRTLEAQALSRLRHPAIRRRLREHLE